MAEAITFDLKLDTAVPVDRARGYQLRGGLALRYESNRPCGFGQHHPPPPPL